MNSSHDTCPGFATPAAVITFQKVRANILRSRLKLQFSTYQTSRASLRSQSIALRAVHLRPPGNSWLNRMATTLFRGVAGNIAHFERPGAYQAHFAGQYGQQLGQFIEAGASQEFSKCRETKPLGQQRTMDAAGVGHRPKLQTFKHLPVQTRPGVPKDDRTAHKDSHQSCIRA